MNRSQVGVLWHSIVSLPTGYGVSSRQLVCALDALGVDVRLAYIWGSVYMEPPDDNARITDMRFRPRDLNLPQVVYALGDNFCKNSGQYKIGYTMFEYDGLPRDWIEQANQMDEVWVPSTFNSETFRSSGVRRPVHVMPLGVNPRCFNPEAPGHMVNGRYTFLSVLEWVERKAPDLLLRAYTEEFKETDDVLLIVKISNSDPSVNVYNEIASWGLPKDSAPVCLVYNQTISEREMAVLYRSVDCFVLPTRGEGWCMPAMEAMACGLPVIITAWSAHVDFISEDSAYPISYGGLSRVVSRSPYAAGQHWADPDIDHLRHLMRHVYEHPQEAESRGMSASKYVLSNWTWDKAATRIRDRLAQLQ